MKIGRRLLYAIATNDDVERVVRGVPWGDRWAFRAARRYVAGRTLADAVATVERLRADGLAASLDLFGESLSDPEAIGRVVQGYVQAARAISELRHDVYLEVVPSHLGIDISVDFFKRQVDQVVESLPDGTRLEVSAEESWRTDRILEAVLSLAKDGAPLVATVQANLRRSSRDAERLAEGGVPVRLVKGAYVESPYQAHAWGEATDVAYVRLATQLHRGGVQLAIGTHDPVLREALLMSLPGVRVEMLLGVRPDDAMDLARRGNHVRIYVPYGEGWFRYWLRRVAESRGS